MEQYWESRCVLFNNRDLRRWNIESGFVEFGFVHDDKWSDGCRDALFLLFASLLEWDVRHGKRRKHISHVRRYFGTNQRRHWYLHVDTREWFYVSAYLQCRLYCFGHEFVYFGRFDRRDVFG